MTRRTTFRPIASSQRHDVQAVADWIVAHIPCHEGGPENSEPRAAEDACWAIRQNCIPPQVGLAAMQRVFGLSFSRSPGPFPNIRSHAAPEVYADALAALNHYRRYHIDHHPRWSAVDHAVRRSSQRLNHDGTLTVEMSPRGWEEFAAAMVGYFPAKLQEHVRDRTVERAQSRMGMLRRGQNISNMVRTHLDTILMYPRIYQDIRGEALARLNPREPQAVQYRTRYFLAVLAGNPGELERRYNRHRAYEEAHWRLSEFVQLNRTLPRGAAGRDFRVPERDLASYSGRRHPADTGIRETGLLDRSPCIVLMMSDVALLCELRSR